MAIIPSTDKFFTHSENVNTTIGGPASAQAESHWYTINDLADSVKPYKVFTALLTQSGGDQVEYQYFGDLTIGVTYLINEPGSDFTNVGAPNNNVGTYFVATGTTPAYWDGTELEYNTGAPVATVLENTIGNITWIYNNAGEYICNLGNAFPINKTIYDKNNQFLSPAEIDDKALIFYSNLDAFYIYTSSYDLSILKDGVLLDTPIEIRVYN